MRPFCRPQSADAASEAANAFPMAPPPDAFEEGEVRVTLAEMSEEAVEGAIATIKAAFLRFFASLMAKYQDYMVVPPSEIYMPAAVDFFDLPRWMTRFSGPCTDWLSMFAASQSFTEFFEVRLAPPDAPVLDVVFFNELVDAKLARSAKTRLFAKHSTPLLTTGEMPPGGYGGQLVPPAVRTVYNASLIAARPVQAQQQVGLLLVLGSGLQENEPELVGTFAASLKQEFARNLLWSRVDVDAALLPHVVPWRSVGAEHHQHFKRLGVESLAVRQTMMDLMAYADEAYRAEQHNALRQSLRRLAQDGGANLPLCVVAHGFGSVVAVDFFTKLQREAACEGEGAATSAGTPAELSPLERGLTLASLATLGSPLPLLVRAAHDSEGAPVKATPAENGAPLRVPAEPVLRRWPHLRSGWVNYGHRADCLSYPLQGAHPAVTTEVECRRRHKSEQPVHNSYYADLEQVVGPIAQSISWVWQDTNRTAVNHKRSDSRRE